MSDDEIRDVLAGLRQDEERRNTLLTRFQHAGAVCQIDELAVRAIEHEGLTLRDAIYEASGRVRMRLNERLQLFWREGKIHALYKGSDEVLIVEDHVFFASQDPNTAWRPRGAEILSLTTHPVFTAGMTILALKKQRDPLRGWQCKLQQKVFFADAQGMLREETLPDRHRLKLQIVT
ncbi:hypothetical protein AB5I41_15020 [Sphingomonas sp. MMS24-JH45]